MDRELISREECKEIQIGLLELLHDECNKLNLKYYLAYGTLLGAVRHKGFIPWDDDIDVFLMRKDYDILINALKNEFQSSEEFAILDSDIKDYYYPFAKLVDNHTVAKMDDNLTPHGIWIDIFPMDSIPEDVKACKKFIRRCYIYRDLTLSMTTDFQSKKLGYKRIPKMMLNMVASLVGKDKICSRYSKMIKTYDASEEDYIACLSSPYMKREKFKQGELVVQADFEFEGRIFKGPRDYNNYLSVIYGDYMKLPPEKDRRVHSITAWRKRGGVILYRLSISEVAIGREVAA